VHLSEHLVFGERTVQKTFDVFGLEDSIAYQEPQLLRQIKHPNIVPVFDAICFAPGVFPLPYSGSFGFGGQALTTYTQPLVTVHL
jgi:hypothetical protein